MKSFKKTNYIISIFTLVLIGFAFACQDDTTKNQNNNTTDPKLNKAFDKAKMIFYSLPSPIETAMILENAGTSFNEDLLNPTSNAMKYNTNKSMALNLGIYSADMSYASLFEQHQTLINYLAVSKKLAEQLGILDAINDSVVGALKENINNKTEIMNIISETYSNSNAYLEENQRQEIATMIVLGGWIEGLYLSTMLVGNKVENNEELLNIILDQQLSLEDLISLMEFYKQNKDIGLLVAQLQELKTIFERLQSPVTQDEFVKLANKVKDIRTEFVK